MRRSISAAVLLVLLAACTNDAGNPPALPSRTPTSPPPSSSAPPALPPAPTAGWLTYHENLQRTGIDTTSPRMHDVHRAWTSPTLDGAVYAEPLVAGNRVFVATENDSVYSLDARSGAIVWRTNIGQPIPLSQLPCGNIDPSGITGTPAIDPKTGTLYAVAFVQPGHHEFVAIDTRTGRLRWRASADAPGADPLVHQQRGALAIANGRVYAPYGGLQGDCGDYHGRVVGRALDGSGQLLSYQVPAQRAGIWGTSGIAAYDSGHLLVATGNGGSTTTFDYGDAVIRLSPDLKVVDRWAPANWRDLNGGDVDLGSIGPSILPSDLVFQSGKEGVGYLLRLHNLGGIGGAAFARPVCDGGAWGGTAADSSHVYVPCGDGVVALRVHPSSPSFEVAWRTGSFNAGPPIVAGGAVWSVDIYNGRLLGFDVRTGRQVFSQSVDPVEHFTTPTAADGRLYVAAEHRIVAFADI
jgi:outer membrane protein assembly factor BamB